MLEAAQIDELEIVGKAKQKAQFVEAEIGAGKRRFPALRLGGLDQAFQAIERGGFDLGFPVVLPRGSILAAERSCPLVLTPSTSSGQVCRRMSAHVRRLHLRAESQVMPASARSTGSGRLVDDLVVRRHPFWS